MEQPITNSTTSSTGISTKLDTINEIPSLRDTMVPLSVPSTETERSQPIAIKSVNRRMRFPFRLYPSKQRPHTPEKDVEKSDGNYLDSKKRIVPSFFSQVKTKRTLPIRPSIADNKLEGIIQDLNENPIEDEAFKEEKTPVTGCSKWIRQSRHFLKHLMEQPKFHYTIIILIIIDLIVVFIELTIAQLSLACATEEEMNQYNITQQRPECLLPPSHPLESGELALYYISLVIICIFVLEISAAYYTFGWRRYTKILYLLDAIIIFSSFILEVYFHFGAGTKAGRASAGLVVLRLWKIVRAIHAIAHSISLRNHMIMEEIEKARTILKEENLQAEKTIREQEIEIDNLMNLLRKTDTLTTPEQVNETTRRRAKSFHSHYSLLIEFGTNLIFLN